MPEGPAGHRTRAGAVSTAGECRRLEISLPAALGEAPARSRKTRVRLPPPPPRADDDVGAGYRYFVPSGAVPAARAARSPTFVILSSSSRSPPPETVMARTGPTSGA